MTERMIILVNFISRWLWRECCHWHQLSAGLILTYKNDFIFAFMMAGIAVTHDHNLYNYLGNNKELCQLPYSRLQNWLGNSPVIAISGEGLLLRFTSGCNKSFVLILKIFWPASGSPEELQHLLDGNEVDLIIFGYKTSKFNTKVF